MASYTYKAYSKRNGERHFPLRLKTEQGIHSYYIYTTTFESGKEKALKAVLFSFLFKIFFIAIQVQFSPLFDLDVY